MCTGLFFFFDLELDAITDIDEICRVEVGRVGTEDPVVVKIIKLCLRLPYTT